MLSDITTASSLFHTGISGRARRGSYHSSINTDVASATHHHHKDASNDVVLLSPRLLRVRHPSTVHEEHHDDVSSDSSFNLDAATDPVLLMLARLQEATVHATKP
jgi:hypothetical protein